MATNKLYKLSFTEILKKIMKNYTLTAKDPKQQGLKGLKVSDPIVGVYAGSLLSRATDFGSIAYQGSFAARV